MKKGLIVFAVIVALVACKSKDKSQPTGKFFEVSGVIKNNTAKMIYLEEIPMTTMQRRIVDSFALGKGGNYVLKTDTTEAMLYTIRLDKDIYPLVAVINDVPKITVDATINKEDSTSTTKYKVKNSTASLQLKEFMATWDSLARITPIVKERRTAELKNLVKASIARSTNPALIMYELAYYQISANNSEAQMEPMTNEEVKEIVTTTAAKFPSHQGLASIKGSLMGWVGQQAPEISLPDATGKEIKLSSFRGKYVLVDFWASWCKPCREENPNVVKAYNRFKDKNFTILGVSLDNPDGKEKWLKAVKQDNLNWTQVSDLKGWQSAVVPVYKFSEAGIPYNILVDREGKIIAERLRGEALEAKLAEVLK